MRRALSATVVSALLIAAVWMACALLPERYAVNAPMVNMMSGWMGADAPAQDQFGARIRVQPGFSVGLFADQLPGVRFLRPLPAVGSSRRRRAKEKSGYSPRIATAMAARMQRSL